LYVFDSLKRTSSFESFVQKSHYSTAQRIIRPGFRICWLRCMLLIH